jgi:hypothetical protein
MEKCCQLLDTCFTMVDGGLKQETFKFSPIFVFCHPLWFLKISTFQINHF